MKEIKELQHLAGLVSMTFLQKVKKKLMKKVVEPICQIIVAIVIIFMVFLCVILGDGRGGK